MDDQDKQAMIDYESTLDSIIEELGAYKAYAKLREGLNELQKELEEKGIKGNWN